MPPSEISAVWPLTTVLPSVKINRQFARQPFMAAAVADLGQAEKDHAARLETFRQSRHVLARMIDGFAMRRGTDRGLLDFGRAVSDRADEVRTVAGIARKSVGGCDLVLHRAGDAREYRADGLGCFDDTVYGGDGNRSVFLQHIDLAFDFLGGVLRLHRKRFDFRGDHRETAAGLTGARSLDRRVEREQVGLPGDRGDQVHDLTDFGGRRFQAVDALVRGNGRVACIVGQRIGDTNLLIDFARGLGEFLGGAGDLVGVALGVLRFGGECFSAGANGCERLRRGAGPAANRRRRLLDLADHRAQVEFQQIDGFANRCRAARANDRRGSRLGCACWG